MTEGVMAGREPGWYRVKDDDTCDWQVWEWDADAMVWSIDGGTRRADPDIIGARVTFPGEPDEATVERAIRETVACTDYVECGWPECSCGKDYLPKFRAALAAIGSGTQPGDIQTARLPFDVQIGATRFRAGVHLSTLISAAQRWHDLAQPPINEERSLPKRSGTQGRDAVIEECAQIAETYVWCGSQISRDAGVAIATKLRALASPEKVTAPELAEVDEAINKLRKSVETTPAEFTRAAFDNYIAKTREATPPAGHGPHDCDGGPRCINCGAEYNRVTTPTWCDKCPVTPPAPSDLRERAEALKWCEEIAIARNYPLWPNGPADLLAAKFAAIRVEAKAEGWEDAVRALRKMQSEAFSRYFVDGTSISQAILQEAADRLAANRPSPTGREGY